MVFGVIRHRHAECHCDVTDFKWLRHTQQRRVALSVMDAPPVIMDYSKLSPGERVIQA